MSGPLLDRIDLHIEVPRLTHEKLLDSDLRAEPSSSVRQRVEQARQRQEARQGKPNSQLDVQAIECYCRLADCDAVLLATAVDRLQLSSRAGHRIQKLARTIADLDDATEITSQHVSEAIALRRQSEPSV